MRPKTSNRCQDVLHKVKNLLPPKARSRVYMAYMSNSTAWQLRLSDESLYLDTQQNPTRGVSQCGLVIYIKKYLKAKEKLWKLKYFTMQII
jgi:hypothetical protein